MQLSENSPKFFVFLIHSNTNQLTYRSPLAPLLEMKLWLKK